MRRVRFCCVPAFLLLATAGPSLAQFTPPANLSQLDGYWDTSPSLDRDAGGNLHVAWKSWNDNAPTTIWYAHNVGGFWKKEVVTSTGSGAPGNVALLVTPDSLIHVFFSTAGGDWTAYECTKSLSGGAWSNPQRVNTSGGGGSIYFTSAARDASGGIFAIYMYYTSAPAVYGRYKPAGQPWGAEETVVPPVDNNYWGQGSWVTANGNDFYFTYYLNQPRLPRYRVRHAGGAWDAPLIVGSHGFTSRIAFSPTGEWAYCWFDDRGNCDLDFPIYIRFSTNQGASWGPTVEVSQNCYISRNPEITYDADGNLYVYWEQADYDGDRFDVYYRNRTAAGTWDANATRLTDGTQRCGTPMNAIRADGNNLFNLYTQTTTNLYEDIWLRTRWVQPVITLSKTSIARTTCYGASATGDSFTVRNSGVGTMNYTVASDAPWLSVSPGSGSSTGATSTFTVSLDTPSLPMGTHSATITIAATGAFNTPQRIPVTVDIRTTPSDFDADGDVDQADFGRLQRCLTGNGGFAAGACSTADLDGDTDVDSADLTTFLSCFTGPDQPVGPVCCPW